MSDTPPVDFNKWPAAITITAVGATVVAVCWIVGEVVKAIWT